MDGSFRTLYLLSQSPVEVVDGGNGKTATLPGGFNWFGAPRVAKRTPEPARNRVTLYRVLCTQ